MKISKTKNKLFKDTPIVFVELGDHLFFGGKYQQTYPVTHFIGSRPFSGEVDLFELSKVEQPVCLTNKEF